MRDCLFLLWVYGCRVLALILMGLTIVALPKCAQAQDPFEIRLETYEELPPGGFKLEQHFNYVAKGTTTFDGTVAPAHHQFHSATELTGGIVPHVSLGFILLTAAMPGQGFEYAGWRLIPHFYIPDTWHLPVKIGLTAEFSFQRTEYDESPRTLELKPVLERNIGRVQIDVNPSFERSLATRDQWTFEPAARISYRLTPHIRPALEYYSVYVRAQPLLPVREQVHQIFPGADLDLGNGVLWNFGIGIGLTPAGNRLVYKTKLEFSFGRKPRS